MWINTFITRQLMQSVLIALATIWAVFRAAVATGNNAVVSTVATPAAHNVRRNREGKRFIAAPLPADAAFQPVQYQWCHKQHRDRQTQWQEIF